MPTSTDFIREDPFDTYRDELEQHRTDSHFLGHTMFWKHSDQIPVKHIYHTDNIESLVPTKDRIEILNFSIEFLDQLRNFQENFSNFCKCSAILSEFGYFRARSRNSDKISSRFRREIAVFLQKL